MDNDMTIEVLEFLMEWDKEKEEELRKRREREEHISECDPLVFGAYEYNCTYIDLAIPTADNPQPEPMVYWSEDENEWLF